MLIHQLPDDFTGFFRYATTAKVFRSQEVAEFRWSGVNGSDTEHNHYYFAYVAIAESENFMKASERQVKGKPPTKKMR